jgi:hypothetical protein
MSHDQAWHHHGSYDHASHGHTSGRTSPYETGPDGMIQDIDEAITVLTRFSGGAIDPLRFKWKNRIFNIDRVTGKWEEHDGQYKLHFFSVVTKEEDYYELIYNTRTMGWTLSRTDLEG